MTKKTYILTNLKNSNGDKIRISSIDQTELKLWQNLTQIASKLRNSNSDKTQIVTKFKNCESKKT